MALLVALALVLAALMVADRSLRAQAESRVEADLREAFAADGPEVDIGGAVFLPHVLSGRVPTAQVRATSAQIDAFEAREVSAQLTGVHVREPYRVEHLRLTAVAPVDTLQGLLARAGVPAGVEVEVTDDGLVAEGSLLGVPLQVGLTPEARGRTIGVGLDTVRLGGTSIDVTELPPALTEGLTELEVTMDDLPPGLLLEDIQVHPDGLRLRIEGHDVVLEDW